MTVSESFLQYLKSIGPGIVVILTWLGAGDLVGAAAAGGNYGYALMWVFALCLIIRCLFVSIIAKYQLCNQHRESVLAGLARLHPLFSPFVFFSALLVGHAGGIYTLVGAAQAGIKLTQFGRVGEWAIGLALLAVLITYRNVYPLIEKVLFLLAGTLTVSLILLAVKAGPAAGDIAKGVFAFQLPESIGKFDAVFVAVSLVGHWRRLGQLDVPLLYPEEGVGHTRSSAAAAV